MVQDNRSLEELRKRASQLYEELDNIQFEIEAKERQAKENSTCCQKCGNAMTPITHNEKTCTYICLPCSGLPLSNTCQFTLSTIKTCNSIETDNNGTR